MSQSDALTATAAIERLIDALEARHMSTGLVRRWKEVADRLAKLGDTEARVFDRVLTDLTPAMTRIDASLSDTTHGDLRAMARRVELTIDVLASPDPSWRLDEAALTVRHARIDLAELVKSCATPFVNAVHDRGATMTVSATAPLYAEVDPDKLELALLSLLFNACRHVVAGGRVDCALVSLGGEHAELRVGDDGFRRKRRDSVHDVRHGRGVGSDSRIGIGIARDLIVLSGGVLLVDAAGATYRARIPLRAPVGVSVAGSSRGTSSVRAAATAALVREATFGEATIAKMAERPRVLVAEDSPLLHRLIVDALEPRYETVSAFDGAEALAAMLERPPDLVILDLAMPHIDGEEVLREARAHEDLADVPILVVSGAAETTLLVRLLETGAQDVLYKPFLVPELVARANNLVAAKRTRDLLNDTIGHRETDLVTLAEDVAQRQRALESTLAELDSARRAAEAAGRLKGDILRMMSHELRTPITAMELQLELLERSIGATLDPATKEGLDRVARSSRRLSHLVDTVLVWARVESERVQLDVGKVDLASLARDAIAEIRGYAAQKRLVIELRSVPHPEPVSTDRSLVRLLVVNLLNRAVQVTTSGTVYVDVRCGVWGAEISITDRGTPLTPEELETLRSRVGAVSDLHRQSGAGSGLDLHIVRDIARAVEGDVTTEKHDGVGNILTLCLPSLPQDHVTDTTHVSSLLKVGAGG